MNNQPEPVKEMLVAFFTGRVEVLVPKKRGMGFLKVPVGHHDNAISKFMRDRMSYGISGLDGSLEIEIGRYRPMFTEEAQRTFVRQYIQPLADHLGFGVRTVSQDEYWERHPLIGSK